MVTMTSTDFSHILQEPEALIPEQAGHLKSIIEEFPYFQPARALYLKGLKTNESFKYNQELKTTAAYTTDRSILFDFITSEAFVQNEISQFIKQNTLHLKNIDVDVVDISVGSSKTGDDIINQHIEDTQGVLDPELFQPKITPAKLVHFTEEHSEALENTSQANSDKQVTKAEDVVTSEETPETILEIGKPLDFNNSETHSFNEWLKLTSFNPVNRSETQPTPPNQDVEDIKVAEEDIVTIAPQSILPEAEVPKQEPEHITPSPEQVKKFALIDKFISTNPKIDPKKSSGVSQNLAESHVLQPESLMTETLARIYVEQKNYKKAIQSYNILSLKYPEKSGFFADRIKAVKQIQEQNKKN